MTYREMIAFLKQAKNIDEVIAYAKENGFEISEEVAKDYYEKYCGSGELADDELENVSGGGCNDSNEAKPITPAYQKECFVCNSCYAKFNGRQTHGCSVQNALIANYCTDCLFYRDFADGVRGDFCKR